jgi:quinol monooxygenase YgiN
MDATSSDTFFLRRGHDKPARHGIRRAKGPIEVSNRGESRGESPPSRQLQSVTSMHRVIFITAKFRVRGDEADQWPEIVKAFTEATRSEPGCLWFDWSRRVEDPTEYVLVEAFRDDEAGAAHVHSAHFAAARQELPAHLVETPRIVNMTLPQDDWSLLGEMAVSE